MDNISQRIDRTVEGLALLDNLDRDLSRLSLWLITMFIASLAGFVLGPSERVGWVLQLCGVTLLLAGLLAVCSAVQKRRYRKALLELRVAQLKEGRRPAFCSEPRNAA